MLNQKEITFVIIISLILAFTISLMESLEIFLYTLLFIFLILLINTFAKKIAAFYLDSEIKIKLWELKRFGLLHFMNITPIKSTHPSREFKKPFLAGAFLPIIVTAFSFGYLTWMASLIFEVKSKTYKAAKRHGFYSFTEMPEYHIGLIAASGILANLLFALIGYLINFPLFTKLNIYYAFFNMIPISSLDGNKIFFGSKLLWSFLTIIVLIALGISFVI